MKRMGIGIIGYGGIGKVHILGYRSLSSYYRLDSYSVDLIGICTAHEETALEAQKRHGFKTACTDYRELLDNREIDIIDCTAPNHLHHRIVIGALDAGKYVYCEKPLAMNVAEAEDMVKKATSSRSKCQIAFNYRFVPAILRAEQLIKKGDLGKIYTFRAAYLHSGYIDSGRPMSWRLRKSQSGGGALFDLGSHCIDMIRYLVGEFKAVFANNYTFVQQRPVKAGSSKMERVEVDDLSLLHAELKNGAVGTVEASRISTGSVDELIIEIHGDKGSLRFNLMDPNWLYYYDTGESNEPLGGKRGFKRIETLQRYTDTDLTSCSRASVGWQRFHIESQYNFLKSIINNEDPKPDFSDGLAVQKILEASYLSAQNKSWVNID